MQSYSGGWISEKTDKSISDLKFPARRFPENIPQKDSKASETATVGEEKQFILVKGEKLEENGKTTFNIKKDAVIIDDLNNIGEHQLTKNDFLLPIYCNKDDLEKNQPIHLNIKKELDSFKDEKSLQFDGLKDYLKIPHNKDFNFGNQDDFTVEVWLKIDKEQLDKEFGDNSIIEKWNGAEGYPFAIRYEQETGKIWAHRYDGNYDKKNKLQVAATVNSSEYKKEKTEEKIRIDDGLFHHIAFVKNGDKLYLYIDGTKVHQSNKKYEPNNGELEFLDHAIDITHSNNFKNEKNEFLVTTNKSPLYIACRGRSYKNTDNKKKTRNHFRGQVDEIRIWKVARSEEEIKTKMFELGFDKLKDKVNLVGFWDFKNKNINNRKGHSDSSQLQGSPQWSTQTRRNFFPEVDHQDASACTAYAVASAFEYGIRRAEGNDIRISRSFIHENAKFLSFNDKQLDDNNDVGVSIKAVLKAMNIFGVLEEKYWLNKKSDGNTRTMAYALAQNYVLKEYLNLYRSGMSEIDLLDQIKLFIYAEFPIVFGLPLSETVVNLSKNSEKGDIPFQFFCKKTGHTLLAVGYDDNKVITGYQEILLDDTKIDKFSIGESQNKDDVDSRTNSLLNRFLFQECKKVRLRKPHDDNDEEKQEHEYPIKKYIIINDDVLDDDVLRFSTKGAFKVRNSWGSDWGEQGYGWLPYAYLLTGLATDWYCIFDPEWNEMGGWGINNSDCKTCNGPCQNNH